MIRNKQGFLETEPYEDLFIRCTCNEEGLSIEPDYEDNSFYLSFWQRGLSDTRYLTFKDKLRWCWNIFTKGKPFNDEIIISSKEAIEICEYFLTHHQKMMDFWKARTMKIQILMQHSTRAMPF